MTERISVGRFYPHSLHPAKRPATPPAQHAANRKSFSNVLQDNLVRISHHAEERLQQRGIDLSGEQLAKIQSAIDKAAQKGARDSLMLMNDLALIVNIKNKTVVTAMDAASLKDNVFTQIDSAVIIS